ALLWAVHPLNTEAVDYLTQRTESMVALFYLLTLYAAMRAVGSRREGWWIAAAGLFNLCGVATKESMVTAPFILILADRAFFFDSFRTSFRKRWRVYLVLSAGWVLFAFLVRRTPFFSPTGFDIHVSVWTYLLNQAVVITDYLRLALLPRNLVFDYGVAR